MATLIGRAGMVIKGAWDSSVAYDTLDVVTYNNNTYIAKQASPEGTLPTNTTYWQLSLDASQLQPKEAGKGLSTNDYTDADKQTVGTVANKANKPSSSTAGNLAALDASGDITDSNLKKADVSDTVDLLSNNLMAKVELTNDYTESSPYTCPTDGYICVYTAGSKVAAYITGANGSQGFSYGYYNTTNPEDSKYLYVKKGMKVYIMSGYPIVSGTSVRFYRFTS